MAGPSSPNRERERRCRYRRIAAAKANLKALMGVPRGVSKHRSKRHVGGDLQTFLNTIAKLDKLARYEVEHKTERGDEQIPAWALAALA